MENIANVGSEIETRPMAGRADRAEIADVPRTSSVLDESYQSIENLMRANQLDQAEAAITRRLTRAGNNHYILMLQGIVLYKKGNYDSALDILQQSLRLRDKSHLAYYYLGRAHKERDEFDNAVQAFSKALRIHPRFAPARDQLTELGIYSDSDIKQSGLRTGRHKNLVPESRQELEDRQNKLRGLKHKWIATNALFIGLLIFNFLLGKDAEQVALICIGLLVITNVVFLAWRGRV